MLRFPGDEAVPHAYVGWIRRLVKSWDRKMRNSSATEPVPAINCRTGPIRHSFLKSFYCDSNGAL